MLGVAIVALRQEFAGTFLIRAMPLISGGNIIMTTAAIDFREMLRVREVSNPAVAIGTAKIAMYRIGESRAIDKERDSLSRRPRFGEAGVAMTIETFLGR